METELQRQRARERAAIIAEWRLQWPVTFEEACEHGAAWIRFTPARVERFMLDGTTIAELGRVPDAAEAYDIHRMRMQQDRLRNG
jgi:uncharacterized iron-regulated membrane protein